MTTRTKKEIQEDVQAGGEAWKLVEKAQETLVFWQKCWKDDGTGVSGWAHNFFCPECASGLVFDPGHFQAGGTYRCSACGKLVSGKDYDEAWWYYLRQQSAAALEDIALLAKLEVTPDAREFIIRYISWYAQRYQGFPAHGRWAGRGKVMGQSLDEAVWAIHLLTAASSAGIAFDEDPAKGWWETLFKPLAGFVDRQVDRIHNIPLWMKCAVGIIALAFGDDALLDHALNGRFGIREQAEQGFTADGFWYEGSVTYHYYALEALTGFCMFYYDKNPEDPIHQKAISMYAMPWQLSWDGWEMPALNNGWPHKTLGSFAGGIARAAGLYRSPELQMQVECIRRRDREALAQPRLLLYTSLESSPEADGSPGQGTKVFSSTGLAMLRGAFPVLLKSGVLTPSHAHPDAMMIEVPPFSVDLGTTGYGNVFTREWYRSTPCHNTVAVNGRNQTGIAVGDIEKTDTGLRACTKDVYQRISYTRELAFHGDQLLDTFRVDAGEAVTADWFFSAAGEVTVHGDREPLQDGIRYQQDGYRMMKKIRAFKGNSPFEICFSMGGKTLALRVGPDPDMEVFTAETPDNPAGRQRTTVIIRRRGAHPVFRAVFQMQ